MMDWVESDREEEEYPEQKSIPWDDKQHLDVLKHYSEEEIIPKEIRDKEWQFFTRAVTNTFLEKEDLGILEDYYQIIKADTLSSIPSSEITFEDISNLDKLMFHTFISGKRAIGIEKTKINERVLQNMQIMQSISTNAGLKLQKRNKFLGLF